MKLYATVKGDRIIDGKVREVSKGQGGNNYLEIGINVLSDTPGYRVRVVNDELLGIVYITLETLQFEKWRVVYTTEEFYNVEQG